MPNLTKTRTVLQHNGTVARHTADVERGPVFDSADEDGGRLTVLTLDQSVWEDMGSPHEITVTIEPGDLLNVETDDEVDARAVSEGSDADAGIPDGSPHHQTQNPVEL